MDYIFGRNDKKGYETLRTKGPQEDPLTGFNEVVQEYPDCTITDSFFVEEQLKTDTDSEGNHYTWYKIGHHNRMIDRTKPIQSDINTLITSILEGK